MIPDGVLVLGDLARVLMEEVSPELQPGLGKTALSQVAMMLGAAAMAWDGAAENLAAENRALRALFAQAAVLLDGTGTQAALRDAASGRDEDIRISTLQSANELLRAALIGLHQAVEGMDDQPARDIEAQIWHLLQAGTAWRRTPFDLF